MAPRFDLSRERAEREIAAVNKAIKEGYEAHPIAGRTGEHSAVRVAADALGENRVSFQNRVGSAKDAGVWKKRYGIEPQWDAPPDNPFAIEHDAPPIATSGGHSWELVSNADNTFRFAAFGDLHAGSKYCRYEVREDLTRRAEKFKAQCIFDTGNWIDGEKNFNRYDLEASGLDNQIRMLAARYPKSKIPTYAVTGADHEGWYCFEPSVEILTLERGWVKIIDLTGNESVATKTSSDRFEWQVPTKIIRKQHNGELIRFRHRSIDVAVTPDHRFEVIFRPRKGGTSRSIKTAAQILKEFKPRRLGIPRTLQGWVGKNKGEIRINRQDTRYKAHPRVWHPETLPAKDLALLCAWYVTEGHIQKNTLRIAQSSEVNQENRELITELITRLGGTPLVYPHQIIVCSADLCAWMHESCGHLSASKHLPRWVLELPKVDLEKVFDVLVRGDGHDRGEGSGWVYYTTSKALEAQMAEIAQKLSLTVSYNKGNACTNVHIGEVFKTAFLFEKPIVEAYSGEVVCVSVPNERIFVRNRGKTFWSMNCKSEGIDVGRYCAMVMCQHGHDWHDLGYMQADVILRNANTGKTAVLRIMHPGGGSSYAISYRPQKILESMEGGEKPNILLLGHYHKLDAGLIRNVFYGQTGCGQDQTPFMAQKSLEAHVGGLLIECEQDPKTGAIVSYTPQLRRYFNRAYYFNEGKANDRWSGSGLIKPAPRGTQA